MSADPAYAAMMKKLRYDFLASQLGRRPPNKTEAERKEEAEMNIEFWRRKIQREQQLQQQQQQQAAAQQQAQQQQQTAPQQQAQQQQQTAPQQQQQTAPQQQQTAPQQQQGYGGLFSSSFSGGRGRKHKSPRRKNKTHKSIKSRRLYKSRKRHR